MGCVFKQIYARNGSEQFTISCFVELEQLQQKADGRRCRGATEAEGWKNNLIHPGSAAGGPEGGAGVVDEIF